MAATSTRPSADHVERAAAAYTRAFMDDPVSLWISPDETQRGRVLPPYFRMAMRYALRYGGQVDLSDDAPRGVGTWLAPAHPVVTTVGMLRSGLWPLLWQLPPSAVGRFLAFGHTLETLHRQDVQRPHCYLWLLGVDPPCQGKGVGGAILRPRLREADQRGLACYLETTRESNVSLYLRFGFRVHKEGRFGRDGPRYWTMLREPET